MRIVLVLLVISLTQNFAQLAPIKVACIGNSITQGFGQTNSNSYPNQLDTLLGDNYEVRNFGVGGTTMLKNGDSPYWNEGSLTSAKQFEPNIVIILLGTNDSKPHNWTFGGDFYNDYISMINEFSSLESEPQIFVGSPPPAFIDTFGIRNQVISEEIIPIVDSIKSKFKTYSIDFYNNMLTMAYLFPDGIHPDAEGYKEMSKIAANSILNREPGFIEYFYSSKQLFEEGQSGKLYWKTSQNSQVTLDGEFVNYYDSLIISQTETTTYTLIASGDFYSDTVSISIDYLSSGNIKSFIAVPNIIEKGSNEFSRLFWEGSINSAIELNGNPVNLKDSLDVIPTERTTYKLTASGSQNDTSQVTINVLPFSEINRSLISESFNASSIGYQYDLRAAFDGDSTTYWLSEGNNTEWIMIDLGRELNINRIIIKWGEVFSKLYHLQFADEENNIVSFKSSVVSDGGIDELIGEFVKARQIRGLFISSSSLDEGYEIKEFEIYGTSTDITSAGRKDEMIIDEYTLSQNFPNPFNPTTTIKYSVPLNEGNNDLSLKIVLYDVLGREMKTLLNENKKPGKYELKFNSDGLTSGVYLYQLSSGIKIITKKMILLK